MKIMIPSLLQRETKPISLLAMSVIMSSNLNLTAIGLSQVTGPGIHILTIGLESLQKLEALMPLMVKVVMISLILLMAMIQSFLMINIHKMAVKVEQD